jgi:hypothetical protein
MKQKRNALASAAAPVTRRAARIARRVVLPPKEVNSFLGQVPERIIHLRPSPRWRQYLEKNLIDEGFTPIKARELVKIAAS